MYTGPIHSLYMIEPIPKPVKTGPKPPKPLVRKTRLQAKTPLTSTKTPIRSTSLMRDPASLPQKPPLTSLKRPRKGMTKDVSDERRSLWVEVKAAWLELNPPDLGTDYYQCRLCPYAVHIDEVTLDHVYPRSTHPHLVLEFLNLQAAHGVCNARKGSMSMERYEKLYGVGGCWLGGQI